MGTMVLTLNSMRYILDESLSISHLGKREYDVDDNITVEKVSDLTYVIHRDDDLEVRRLVLDLDDGDPVLPPVLLQQENLILERLMTFFQLAGSTKLRLPITWGKYLANDLVAFFVCSRDRWAHAPRWVTQVTGEARDVWVWRWTTSADPKMLSSIVIPSGKHHQVLEGWVEAHAAARARFSGSKLAIHHSAEMDLIDSHFDDVTQKLSYTGWLARTTPQQLEFIKSTPEHSIKLRGPAGSGKTLTLELKVIFEILRDRNKRAEIRGKCAGDEDRGEDQIRVLFVTHSWALANEVDANLERLSEWGRLDEVTVFPLLSISEEMLPKESWGNEFSLMGEDSLEDKKKQLKEIEDIVTDFLSGDWLTFRDQVSTSLKARLESLKVQLESQKTAELHAFAWDCLIEFGSVLGAAGIFPGARAKYDYLRLSRAPWMMPLTTDKDKELIFYLYESYYKLLYESGRLTADQLVNDFLNYLETFIWNSRRGMRGYDLIFVDEFHLFSVQERQVLRYLTRPVGEYPKLFMAVDPRQSAWELYTGLGDTEPMSLPAQVDVDFGTVSSVDLPTVHRFSPEILELVKHINWEFPDLDLGSDSGVNFANVTSSADPGPRPRVIQAGTQEAEFVEIYKWLRQLREDSKGWQIAIAVLDPEKFGVYKSRAKVLEQGLRMKVTIIESPEDIEVLQFGRRGIVIAPAQFLAGLQFDAVLIVGMRESSSGFANMGYDRRVSLSFLYSAVTRASKDVRIFVNDETGGIPEVLVNAAKKGLVTVVRGAEV